MRAAAGLPNLNPAAVSAAPDVGRYNSSIDLTRDAVVDPDILRAIVENATASDRLHGLEVREAVRHPSMPVEMLCGVIYEARDDKLRIAALSNPNVPAEVALEVFEDTTESEYVRAAAMRHPSLDTEEVALEQIRTNGSEILMLSLAGRKNLTAAVGHTLLDAVANTSGYKVYKALAENSHTPPEVIERLVDEQFSQGDGPPLWEDLISRHPYLTDETLSKVLSGPRHLGSSAVKALLERETLPPGALDYSGAYRTELWSHPSISPDDLLTAAEKVMERPYVSGQFSKVLMSNPSMPASALVAYARVYLDHGRVDDAALEAAAKNPSMPTEVLGELWSSSRAAGLRSAILSNPSASEALLRRAAKSTSATTRSMVAKNPSIPSDALAMLASDSDNSVSATARERAAKRICERLGVDKENTAAIEQIAGLDWPNLTAEHPEVLAVLAIHRNP